MKYLKFYLVFLGLFTAVLPLSLWSIKAVYGESCVAPHSWKEVVQFAQENLPHEGELRLKSDGFGYIKVDDAYIHTLFPMLGLTEKGYEKPPYFRSENSPGAHISVFYADERIIPKEVGQMFSFELKEIVIVRPSKNTSFAVLQVYSPELEKLREKYGLEGKLHGHEYHISIAKKVFR